MNALHRLASRLFARPLWLAPLLGVIAACGFAPLHLWPLTLLAIACLIELTARAGSWKRAALIGWLFGIGHFSLGNNWIATAFTYQAQMPAWLGWIAVFALSLYLAVYPMLAALGAWFFRHRPVALVLAIAATWIISEWLRSWVFTGFAWNPLGVAALGPFDRPGLAVFSAWLGTYGLSGVMVLLAGCWLVAMKHRPFNWRGAMLALVPLAMLLQPGAIRVTDPSGAAAYTLIQPNIAQDVLNNSANFETQFTKTAQLTVPKTPGEQRLVLWPESGLHDYLREGYPAEDYAWGTYAGDPVLARQRIAQVIGPGALLMTGAVDLEIRKGEIVGARNVVTALDSEGVIRGSYAKAHLVPGGEYLPMRELLEPIGLARLVPGDIDFWPGPAARTLDLGVMGKAGVQICYEIVFSGEVVDAEHRPDFIFNPSNDGWFGTWGPPQHLAQARLRAIEEGLPVLRATTNGISAVIDAHGIVRQSIPRGVAGRIDGYLPQALPPTLFSQAGNMLPLGLAAALLGLALLVLRRARG